ncbi:TIR domain-containing protein [Streptomyces sp. NPDC020755]
MRARQNVAHELGAFQGSLGSSRVIAGPWGHAAG